MDVVMRMPDVATVDDTVKLVRWLVEAGSPVRRGDVLVEVETDKAILTIESAITGTLRATSVAAGDEVATGQEIATFDVDEAIVAGMASTAIRAAAVKNDEPSEPISGAAGVVAGDVGISVVQRSEPSGRATIEGGRRSFFVRNREARAGGASPHAEPRAVEPTSYDPGFLLDLYRRMVLIREFEDGVKFLFLEGTMPGTIHQCQGQEATAVGVCAALGAEDFITSTFRGHGHALARGLTVEELLFELFGATSGCCRGKGGSMHVGNMDRGMVPGIAIVGGGIPLASGMALAFKLRKERRVVACFFGDGAVAEGAFHEGVNLAAIWDLPALFVCENNYYGASTRVDRVMRNP
ncbi:MAG: thiamine pyrophosphate-dependent dehydrogenase E1 component subunit alpha, partial [Isosphaeraceae bacterium]